MRIADLFVKYSRALTVLGGATLALYVDAIASLGQGALPVNPLAAAAAGALGALYISATKRRPAP